VNSAGVSGSPTNAKAATATPGTSATPLADTSAAPLDGTIQTSSDPGYTGGPFVSTSLPAGGIVSEAVSSQLVDVVRVAQGAESNIPSLFSASGVRYADGAVNLAFGVLLPKTPAALVAELSG
jgi:hypothetical protein